MTPQRMKIEVSILDLYFPKRYNFENVNLPTEFLDIGLKTQSNKVYRINIRLNSDYPNSLPKVYIVYPLPLVNHKGSNIQGASHDLHTLENDGQFIQICHYKSENWNPNQSLYKVALKARIWLEAYEGHLTSGKPIDHYLKS